MAKCEICAKETTFGNNVSKSIRRTSRSWKPNLKKVKVVVSGETKKITVCSRCLRTGNFERAI